MSTHLNESPYLHRRRVKRLGRIRQMVFGSLDGLLVPLGVVSGVAGGTGDTRAVIVAGLAEAFAGALSMGTGEFISARAEAQVQQAEVAVELEEMRRAPEYELGEMAQLLRDEGLSPDDASAVVDVLARYPRAYAKTMVEKELGLSLNPELTRVPESVTIGLSYLAASMIPLAAYFFLPVPAAFPVSLLVTLAGFVTIGLLRGRLAALHPLKSTAEIVLVGSLSGLGGYALGWLVASVQGR